MKEIETIHAEGHVICHDITVIIKDEIKDTAFRKGHIVTKEDIPKLLFLGKDHLYVWEKVNPPLNFQTIPVIPMHRFIKIPLLIIKIISLTVFFY